MKISKMFYWIIILFGVLIITSCMNPDSSTKHYDDAIPLKYDKIINSKKEIKGLDKNLIVKVLKDRTIDNIKIFTFVKGNDKENVYGGIEIDGTLFDLGIVSMLISEQNYDLISINSTTLCNKKLYRITGILGANYSQSNYYFVKDGSPQHFVSISGNINEIDLDNDGMKEIVSSYGTLPYTLIYKCNEDRILVVDLNKTLQAKAVSFNNENRIFEAFYGENNTRIFKYSKDELVEIKK